MTSSLTGVPPGIGDGPPVTVAAERRFQQLKARSALSDAIFGSAYFWQMATDERGVIQIFNVGAEAMLGYDAVDVVDRITPADISDPQELIKRAAELSAELDTPIAPGFEALVFKAKRDIEDIYELTYVRKDGSRFPAIVSVTALRDVQDDIIGYLLIGTDNTARKEVEAAQALLDQQLRDQQFYTRSLIESNVDALMTTDPQGTVTDVNQQMLTLTGRTRAELISAPFRDFFTDPARADAGIARVLAEHKVTDYELTVRARDGKETFVSYNASTIHDRHDDLQGVFVAARDVTDRRRSERTAECRDVHAETAAPPKIMDPIALVVEDDDDAADVVSNLLEAEGFAVLRASSAEEALQMASQQGLDLITLDTQLPGIDGWQFLAAIRGDATLANVPIVVSGTSDGPLALAGGAGAVLEKPISHAALKLAVTNVSFHDKQDQTRTVLIVDDDPKSVEVIAAHLTIPAYVVVRAYGGQEAIALTNRVQPDLILLDLMMPEVSGFDVVRALKSDPSTAGIPILVVTAREITALDRQALNAYPNHAIRIIRKAGLDAADFMAEVRRALPQH